MAVTISCRSATRDATTGEVRIVFNDKIVKIWPSLDALLADLKALDDDPEFCRLLFLAYAARRSGGNLATFRSLIESRSLTFDLTKANPFTIG